MIEFSYKNISPHKSVIFKEIKSVLQDFVEVASLVRVKLKLHFLKVQIFLCQNLEVHNSAQKRASWPKLYGCAWYFAKFTWLNFYLLMIVRYKVIQVFYLKD